MSVDKFKCLEKYFRKDDWKEFNEFHKQRFLNIKNNYDEMNRLGLDPGVPEFMKPQKRKPSPEPEPEISSTDTSDEEWSWKIEKNKGKKTKFEPPVRKPEAVASEPKVKKTKPVKKTLPIVDFLFDDFQPDCEVDCLDFDIEIEATKIILKKLKSKLTRALKRHKNVIFEEHPLRKNPKRKAAEAKNYIEPKVPDDDDFLFCDHCQQYFEGDCPIHGPLIIIENIDIPADGSDPFRGIHTIPQRLELKKSSIPGAGKGIFAVEFIGKETRFGPYEGVLTTELKHETYINGFAWQIMKNGKTCHYVDAMDISKSNWLRFVNCACVESQQNLVAYQYHGKIYYRTYKDIKPGEELLVWYGDSYAIELGILEVNAPSQQPSTSRCTGGKYSSKSAMIQNPKKDRHEGKAVKRYSCSQCSYSSDNSSDLKKHMLTHTGERPFKCDQCQKGFTQKSNLIKHMRTHTGERPFKCDQCEQGCTSKSNLIIHMRTHTGERPFKCDQCEKGFAQKSDLIIHIRTHTGERPFKCDQCEKRFARKSDLISHMRTHTGDRPFKCDQCEKKFARKSVLIQHTRTHTGERPFKCDQCEQRFTQKSSLIGHMATHTGEYPFKCDQCEKGFMRKPHLISHMRTHTGERPFKCDQCEKRFARKSDLISHMRIHTGEKPFKCTFENCNKAFARNDYLSRHIKNHHSA